MDLHLLQLRRYFSDTTTISEVYRETNKPENLLCYFLEDKDRDLSSLMTEQGILAKKIQGQTAIPYGMYEVIINRSNRFSEKASIKAGKPVDVFMPLLLGVKGFAGIRIHPGIKAEHTEGCLLTGARFVDTDPKHPGYEQIADSQATYDNKVLPLIKTALKTGKVYIDIRKHLQPEVYKIAA